LEKLIFKSNLLPIRKNNLLYYGILYIMVIVIYFLRYFFVLKKIEQKN